MKSDLLRENNLAVDNWPDERFFSTKDSTLKKNTAFVRKIRNFTESSKESLRADFEALNLSKYVAEVATAITEPKIKMTDITFMLQLCSLMHRRYSDFGGLLLDAWKKVFSQQKCEKTPNLSKLRVDLVFFADLITVGVMPENESVRLLAMQLTQLTNGDKENYVNIGIVTSFVRSSGDDWAGVIPRKLLSKKFGATIRRSAFLSKERKSKCRSLFHDYYAGALDRLIGMAKEARRVIASNRRQMLTKGEVHPERREKADQLTAACKKFHEAVSLLADAVDRDPPPSMDELIADKAENDEAEGQLQAPTDADAANWPLFEDEDTRLFYESLQDIRAMIPGILYKESEQATVKPIESTKDEPSQANEASNEELDVEKVESELAAEEQAQLEETEEITCPTSLETGQEGGGGGGAAGSASASSSQKSQDKSSAEPREEEGPASAKMMMDTFITQLPNCVNRDLIDRAAYDFCLNLNKKPNRRRLASTLASVSRTRYDLLPFYARFVATLSPVMPDLSQDLNNVLLHEFRWHLHKKDQVNLESKLKTVRFIGELVKFRIFPADEALNCLKRLLPNFVHHQIDMACGLLDTCGRFLYRSPASHQRTKIYLEIMMRKKNAMHMDSRYSTMIENTFFFCDPPKNATNFGQIELTPLQRFLRQLIWRDLNRNSVNSILKIFRKIDWTDTALVSFVEDLFTNGWQVRFQYIGCLASVLSGLSTYHKDFTTAVVDNIIESVRVGMELNLQTMNQRRLSMVKYLGLLYNYKLVESPVIFATLYSLITFGVSLDYLNPSLIDPPTSLTRIPLVCTLLETCGSYFDRGHRRKKLNIFVVYFQRYYWSKRMHPIFIPPKSVTASSETNKNVEEKAEQPTLGDGDETTTVDRVEIEQFEQIPFPDAVEQQFEETLRHLHMKPSAIKNLAEAEKLVENVERRYAQRLTHLLEAYGMRSPKVAGSTVRNGSALGGTSGTMEAIAEEVYCLVESDLFEDDDLKLDDDDEYSGDEDEFFAGDEELENGGSTEGPKRGASAKTRQRGGGTNGNESEGSSETEGDDDDDTVTLAADDDFEDGGGESGEEDEVEGAEDEDEEDQKEANDDEEEDELVRLGLRPKYIKCPEDDEFVATLEKLTAEAMLSTAGAASTVAPSTTLPSIDSLGVGAAAARQAVARSAAAQTQSAAESIIATLGSKNPHTVSPNEDDENKADVTRPSTSVVPFSLVVRRPAAGGSGGGGTRSRLVPLAVPQSVPFAARRIRMEAEEREEKARLKERVLEMHKAQKEADETNYLNPALFHQIPSNVNRDRWVKYNHPKGAPDAEAVFGSSSASIPPPPQFVNYRNLRR
ncbi:unnamed protein product [Mesocestoides corti]|uniref:MIF4G domain-containing protein n=1 Tax=Mesocestoides corti TaxID=53468 RepID=A0A3P6GZ73_MESCO|nr:unnamed protein product [Mesocestoides corti]